jgi:hypothetical protein
LDHVRKARSNRADEHDVRDNPAQSALFIILLGDFVSELRAFKKQAIPLGLKPPHRTLGRPISPFSIYLRQVCADPQLAPQASDLQLCAEAFAGWLEGEIVALGVNLHAIDVVANLRVLAHVRITDKKGSGLYGLGCPRQLRKTELAMSAGVFRVRWHAGSAQHLD